MVVVKVPFRTFFRSNSVFSLTLVHFPKQLNVEARNYRVSVQRAFKMKNKHVPRSEQLQQNNNEFSLAGNIHMFSAITCMTRINLIVVLLFLSYLKYNKKRLTRETIFEKF